MFYIWQYISTCNLCLWTKSVYHLPLRELYLLPIPNARWDTIRVNFIIELPESAGFNVVMTVVDLVSKRAHFIPIQTMATIEGTVRLILYYVWKLYGLLNYIVLDQVYSLLHSLPKSYTIYSESILFHL